MAQKYSKTPYYYTLLTDFIALLFPQLCIGCSSALKHHEPMICHACSAELPRTFFENIENNDLEKLFWVKTKVAAGTAAYFFSKKSRIQRMIHAFKYNNNPQAAIFLGALLGETILSSQRFSNIDLIIPVPLHYHKLKTRGYNQSEKLAIGLSSILNIPVNTTHLTRVTNNETQTNKGVFDRYKNVDTVFKLEDPSYMEGKHILLVDDVITTGATITACTQKICSVKNTKVSIACLAIASG